MEILWKGDAGPIGIVRAFELLPIIVAWVQAVCVEKLVECCSKGTPCIRKNDLVGLYRSLYGTKKVEYQILYDSMFSF